MKEYFTPFSPKILLDTESKVSNHDEILTWIKSIYNESPVKGQGNFYNTGFTTYFYDDFTSQLFEVDVFKHLKDLILERSTEYVNNIIEKMRELNAPWTRSHSNIRLRTMWFNINPPGGFQGRHHHAPDLLAGTYYISVPKYSGNITFTDPNQFAYYLNQTESSKSLLLSSYTFAPGEGDLLIWPGWMDHEIGVNKTSEEDRISVSFAIEWDD